MCRACASKPTEAMAALLTPGVSTVTAGDGARISLPVRSIYLSQQGGYHRPRTCTKASLPGQGRFRARTVLAIAAGKKAESS